MHNYVCVCHLGPYILCSFPRVNCGICPTSAQIFLIFPSHMHPMFSKSHPWFIFITFLILSLKFVNFQWYQWWITIEPNIGDRRGDKTPSNTFPPYSSLIFISHTHSIILMAYLPLDMCQHEVCHGKIGGDNMIECKNAAYNWESITRAKIN